MGYEGRSDNICITVDIFEGRRDSLYKPLLLFDISIATPPPIENCDWEKAIESRQEPLISRDVRALAKGISFPIGTSPQYQLHSA